MIKVTTVSGSTYTIDAENLTWRRENPTNKPLYGLENLWDGRLNYLPEMEIGKPLYIASGDEWVLSTAIVSMEEFDEN